MHPNYEIFVNIEIQRVGTQSLIRDQNFHFHDKVQKKLNLTTKHV